MASATAAVDDFAGEEMNVLTHLPPALKQSLAASAAQDGEDLEEYTRAMSGDEFEPKNNAQKQQQQPQSAAAAASIQERAKDDDEKEKQQQQQQQDDAFFKPTFVPGSDVSKCTATILRDVTYVDNPAKSNENFLKRALYGSVRQQCDIYLPKTPITKTTPVFFIQHGGGWIRGARKANSVVSALGATNTSVYGSPAMCHNATSMGAVAVAVGYRPGAIVQIAEDVVANIKFCLCDKFRALDPRLQALDPDFDCILAGHSAGAHILMLLLSDPSYFQKGGVSPTRIRACISMSGPYTIRNPFAGHSNWRNTLFQVMYSSAFPDDKRQQDELSPTWRLAQLTGDVSRVEEYWAATRPPQSSADKTDPAIVGHGKTVVPLPPSLLQTHSIPLLILFAESDLGLDNDAHRLANTVVRLPGYSAHKAFERILSANHASICSSDLTRLVIVKFLKEVTFTK